MLLCLEFLYKQSIMHRFIMLKSFIVTDTGYVKLMVSPAYKILQNGRTTTPLFRRYEYAAPEVLNREGSLSSLTP